MSIVELIPTDKGYSRYPRVALKVKINLIGVSEWYKNVPTGRVINNLYENDIRHPVQNADTKRISPMTNYHTTSYIEFTEISYLDRYANLYNCRDKLSATMLPVLCQLNDILTTEYPELWPKLTQNKKVHSHNEDITGSTGSTVKIIGIAIVSAICGFVAGLSYSR